MVQPCSLVGQQFGILCHLDFANNWGTQDFVPTYCMVSVLVVEPVSVKVRGLCRRVSALS
jgi:hypothetical protein